MPIGLSFHTFQALSYTIEVYKGNQKAEKHFGIYALYVMFYPQLVAGPIERPQNILHQFYEKHYFEINRVISGLRLMFWGIIKKVFIADRLSILVDTVYNNPDGQNGLTYFLATFFFTIQIYCDFSGYSDIALGSARVMGFELMQNFKTPYLSKTISEFWKRWHISLSTWFRDYLYIPLGGNKISKIRTNVNIFIVFALSGFWHGANWTYLIWGSLHGVYLLFENFVKIPNISLKKIKPVLVFLLVMFSWIYFRASSIQQANEIVYLIFSDLGIQLGNLIYGVFDVGGLNGISFVSIGISIFIIFLLFLSEIKYGSFVLDNFALNTQSKKIRYVVYYILIILLFFSKNEAQTFIYFQF